MPWFRIDDNLAFHHKVVAAGNPAMGLWVRAGSMCAQQLTDGFVPDHMVLSLGTLAQAKKLVAVGLWNRVEGGYSFHEWEERQPSKASVEAERAAAAERMREHRKKKREATTKAGTKIPNGIGNVTQAFRSDGTGTVADCNGNASLDTSSQVSGLRSPEQTEKFGVGSGDVRDVFGNPDPTRPDPTYISAGGNDSEATKSASRKRPAKALPDDWQPTDAHRAKCQERGIDIAAEVEKFKLHAEANDRRQANWNAAFSMWLTNAKPTLRAVPPADATPPPPVPLSNHWGAY